MNPWAIAFFLSVAVLFGVCVGFTLGCVFTERQKEAEAEFSDAGATINERRERLGLQPLANDDREPITAEELRKVLGMEPHPEPYDWSKDPEARNADEQ